MPNHSFAKVKPFSLLNRLINESENQLWWFGAKGHS